MVLAQHFGLKFEKYFVVAIIRPSTELLFESGVVNGFDNKIVIVSIEINIKYVGFKVFV